MNEGKKGFKNKKQTLAPTTPRNFVAKNATTGGAGAHKDKKKAEKQGDVKHKKAFAESMLDGAAYERSLELQLKIAVVESTLNERDPAAYAKAARSSINKNIGAGAMRDPSDPVRVAADRAIANRERGLGRQRDRYMAKKPERDVLAQQQAQQAIEADKANLPALTRKLEQMEKRFNPNYEYADNHTVWSVNQSLEKQIIALKNRIATAQGGQEEGYHVYSEFDGGKDKPYKYQYTGHTFSDRNSANLKAKELDDGLDYGASQQFHRHIVKDRHPHVKESIAEGQGDFDKALSTISGWYEDESSNPNIRVYHYDDREGGYYADGEILHNLKTGQIKINFQDSQGGDDIDGVFNSVGDAMNALRGGYPGDHGRGSNNPKHDSLANKTLAGPDDLYKTDKKGRKGSLTKSRMDVMKASSPYTMRGGPKGPLPENFDAEYDDEAGMVDNNLETMKRAVQGLDNLVSAGDNLPEWCQEKIAVAKSMLVAVWDYMASEEQGVAKK